MIFGLDQYNALQLYQKAALLGESAVFLMSRTEARIVYSLYYFFGFYVEVLLNEHTGSLLDIIAFEQEERLEKYLENIVLVGF